MTRDYPATNAAAQAARSTGLSRRIAEGTAASVVRQFVTAGGQLLLVPILLNCWGEQRYGEWQVLSAMVTYIALLEFGVQTYVLNRLSQCYARGDLLDFERILHSALASCAVVCAVSLVLIVPAVWMAPVHQWFELRDSSATTARAVLTILSVCTVCSLPLGILGGIYRALGEYARDVNISNVHRLSIVVLTAAIALGGGGLRAVAGMQLLTFILVFFFLCADLRKRHAEVHIGLARADAKLAISFLGPSAFFFLMQISTVLTAYGSVLIIGAKLGALAVAAFAILRTLANLVTQITNSLGSALWREFTVFEARREYEVLDSLHRLAAKVMLCTCLCAVAFLHFSARDVVALWTQRPIGYDQSLLDALLLAQVAATSYLASSLVLGSSNNHRVLAACRVLSSFAGLGAGWFLALQYGAAGVVLAIGLADLALCGWIIPFLACRMTKSACRRFLSDVLLRALPFGGLLYLAVKGSVTLADGNATLVRILVALTAALVAAPTLAWVLWLNRSERAIMRSLIPAFAALAPMRKSVPEGSDAGQI